MAKIKTTIEYILSPHAPEATEPTHVVNLGQVEGMIPEGSVTPPPGGEVLWFESYAAIEETPGEVDTFYVDNSDGQIYIWTEAEGYKPEGEKVRVRPDWVEQDPNHPAYIFNKPMDEGQVPFITRWNVAAGETIVLPVGTEGVNQIRVDWGDGVINNQHSHTYLEAGVKTISITGRLEDFRFANTNISRTKITGVIQWGDIAWVHINFYGCTNLVSLPTGLSPDFRRVTDLIQFLRGTGLSNLPSNLFVLAPNVISLANAFRSMVNLTSIDAGLLANLKDLTTVYAFLQDTPIQAIPEDLFRFNLNLRNFSNAFRNAGMLEIPRKLFWYTENAETFEQCFYGADITSIPYDLFKYVEDPLSFADCFRNTALNNEVPELWLMFPNADGSRCFTLTTGIDNYAEIPTTWGGPADVPMPPQVPVDKRDYWNIATDQPQWLIDGVWKNVSGSGGGGSAREIKMLYSGDMPYTLLESDKNKFLNFQDGGTVLVDGNLMSFGEGIIGVNAAGGFPLVFEGTGFEGGGVFAPSGLTKTVKEYGSFSLYKSTYDPAFTLSGDLVGEGGGTTAITNITQIANRSYNDLQDLPWEFKPVLDDSYVLGLTDINKILLISNSDRNIVIPTGVFTTGHRIIIYNPFNEIPITIDGSALSQFYAPQGFLTKIRGAGRVELFFNALNNAAISGNLIQEYEIRQSPNGTLYKVSVDNSGNQVITAL